MLTPQDIQNKELTKAVFGGYDMAVVDDFLEEVAADFAALYKESAILKSKLKVLVEKVEEYRSTEDAMRMALLTAQKMGDDMLSESKQKSAEMIANAEKMAREKMGTLAQEIANEEARLQAAKEKTAQFVMMAKTIMEKYVDSLDALSELKGTPAPAAPAAEPEAPVQEPAPEEVPVDDAKEEEIIDTAKEINQSVFELFKDEPAPEGEEVDEPTIMFRTKDTTVNWSDDDEPTSPRPKFNFDDLQFGSNYSDRK